MSEILRFPEGFLWGTATASFQIEGGIEDRGWSIWDDFCRWPGKVFEGHTGDVADDHYNRYREDVSLMADLGMQAYRFSISWPRILKDGMGDVNESGVDFYDRLVDSLLEAGIIPYVTLYHWDLPWELHRMGSWAARDLAYRFADYTRVVADRLGDRVTNWITHNEPWVVSFLGYWMGVHAPGWQDLGLALQAAHNVLLSHGLAVPILRESNAASRVGITLNLSPAYPASDSDADQDAARRQDGFSNRWFLDPVYKGTYPEDMWTLFSSEVPRVSDGDMEIISAPLDFLGVNYYTRSMVQAGEQGPLRVSSIQPEGEYTQMGWEVYPQGLTDLLVRVEQDYAPGDIYITENGCAYEDELTSEGQVHDSDRTVYLYKHFIAAHRAIAEGVPLKGYFIWSLLDNFEWAFGYSRRFGIVYVDFETLERYPKDSARYCQAVAQANALTVE